MSEEDGTFGVAHGKTENRCWNVDHLCNLSWLGITRVKTYPLSMDRVLTWLHLSDLHARLSDDWESRPITEALVDDLKRLQRTHGLRPDLVFFTGDVAFGTVRKERMADQYKKARDFLEAVRGAFQPEIPTGNLYVVPGNHDVDREAVTPSETLWLRDPNRKLHEILGEMRNATKQWRAFMDRLRSYRDFLIDCGLHHLAPEDPHLIWSAAREIAGARIGIAGLNSAWSCTDKQEKAKLWCGADWQISELKNRMGSVDFSIALIHHPGNWFTEREDPNITRRLRREFDIVLHGHEHQEWVDADDEGRVIFSGGACYDSGWMHNGYSFGRMNVDSRSGSVWLRQWDRSGCGWVARNIARKAEEGMWLLKGLPQIAEGKEANSWSGEDYLTPAFFAKPHVLHCFGRDDDLAQLENQFVTLQPARAAVYGGPGLGKSTLCSRFLDSPALMPLFGERIYWHSLRGEETLLDLLISLAAVLEVSAPNQESHLLRAVCNACQSKPTLLCLDNIDRLLTGENGKACEDFLLRLTSLSRLSLLVSSRSQQAPLPGFAWDSSFPLRPLAEKESRELFWVYAGVDCTHAEGLPDLLIGCGGVPLAIRLLAQQARSLGSLRTVQDLWHLHGVAFLANHYGESLEAVLTTALAHPWINTWERHALRAVAFSPMGVARNLFDAQRYRGLISPAIAKLCELGLVETTGKAVHLLPPVRDFVLEKIQPYPELEKSLAIKCWNLFEDLASGIGGPSGAGRTVQLRYFLPNVQNALRYGLKSDAWESAAVAIANIARAAAMALLDLRSLCEEALTRVRSEAGVSDSFRYKRLFVGLLRAAANQAESATDYNAAAGYLLEALPMVEGVSWHADEKEKPRVLRDLGDIYFALGDYAKSHKYLEKAKEIFRSRNAGGHVDSCRLTAAEWHIRKGRPELANAIAEEVIVNCKERTQQFETGAKFGSRPDYERVAAKAFFMRGRLGGASKAKAAVRDLVRAAKLFSAAGDARSTLRVVTALAFVLAGAGGRKVLRTWAVNNLIPNPKRFSDCARGNFLVWALDFLYDAEQAPSVRAEYEILLSLVRARLEDAPPR